MRRFEDKVAIVTGGASGIGAATASRLAAEGAHVVVADIQDELGTRVADALATPGCYRHCDIATFVGWTQLVDETIGRFGRLDVVHSNAYTVVRGSATEISEQDWDRQIDVCLKQVFLAAKTCIPHLVKTKGAMVNTASVHTLVGFLGYVAYDAAKGGVGALTRQLAVEFGPHVRVNAVLPGAIMTAAWDDTTEEERQGFIDNTPARRIGTPEEVAAAVCFLASDEASFITGAGLVVDGGWAITKD